MTPGHSAPFRRADDTSLRLNAFVYIVTSPSFNPVTSEPSAALVDKEEVLISVPDATATTVADVGGLFVKMWSFVAGTTKSEKFDVSKITQILIRNSLNCIIPNVYTASDVLTESEKVHVIAIIPDTDKDKLTVHVSKEESLSMIESMLQEVQSNRKRKRSISPTSPHDWHVSGHHSAPRPHQRPESAPRVYGNGHASAPRDLQQSKRRKLGESSNGRLNHRRPSLGETASRSNALNEARQATKPSTEEVANSSSDEEVPDSNTHPNHIASFFDLEAEETSDEDEEDSAPLGGSATHRGSSGRDKGMLDESDEEEGEGEDDEHTDLDGFIVSDGHVDDEEDESDEEDGGRESDSKGGRTSKGKRLKRSRSIASDSDAESDGETNDVDSGVGGLLTNGRVNGKSTASEVNGSSPRKQRRVSRIIQSESEDDEEVWTTAQGANEVVGSREVGNAEGAVGAKEGSDVNGSQKLAERDATRTNGTSLFFEDSSSEEEEDDVGGANDAEKESQPMPNSPELTFGIPSPKKGNQEHSQEEPTSEQPATDVVAQVTSPTKKSDGMAGQVKTPPSQAGRTSGKGDGPDTARRISTTIANSTKAAISNLIKTAKEDRTKSQSSDADDTFPAPSGTTTPNTDKPDPPLLQAPTFDDDSDTSSEDDEPLHIRVETSTVITTPAIVSSPIPKSDDSESEEDSDEDVPRAPLTQNMFQPSSQQQQQDLEATQVVEFLDSQSTTASLSQSVVGSPVKRRGSLNGKSGSGITGGTSKTVSQPLPKPSSQPPTKPLQKLNRLSLSQPVKIPSLSQLSRSRPRSMSQMSDILSSVRGRNGAAGGGGQLSVAVKGGDEEEDEEEDDGASGDGSGSSESSGSSSDDSNVRLAGRKRRKKKSVLLELARQVTSSQPTRPTSSQRPSQQPRQSLTQPPPPPKKTVTINKAKLKQQVQRRAKPIRSVALVKGEQEARKRKEEREREDVRSLDGVDESDE
ncbi:hypothetical protein HDV00_010969 [Rhizophlyctis rosea]|nr:hypothetical protein HDV00_010969 [Rhizophlyctis rosea]